MNSSAALDYTQSTLASKLANDLAQEKEIKSKINEYDKLAQTLLDLSKESTHKVLVPVSDVAYFPGKIKHSNEILVFLGDGYFAQRTAHECQPIIQRRKERLQAQLETIGTYVKKEVQMQDMLHEEFKTDTETRWTGEGLLDIREKEGDETVAPQSVQPVESYDSDVDDDFETQLKKRKLRLLPTKLERKGQDFSFSLSSPNAINNACKSKPVQSNSQPAQEEIKELPAIEERPVPIAKSPADIRKLMEKVAEEEKQREQQAIKPILKKTSSVPEAEPAVFGKIIERNPQHQPMTQPQPVEEESTQPKKVSRFKHQRNNQ